MEQAGPTAENIESKGKVASKDEVLQAFKELSSEQYQKLAIVAKSWLRRYRLDRSRMLPDDLVNEALIRTLDGRRKWKYEIVDFITYLDKTMGSIASHEYAAAKRFVPFNAEDGVMLSMAGTDDLSEPHQDLAELEAAFADEPKAWQYLLLKNSGMTVAEAAKAMGKTTREIEAIKKRANRRIAKLSKSVGNYGEQEA